MAQPAEVVLILESPSGLAFAGPVRSFRAWLAGLPRVGTLAEALGSGQLAGAGLGARGDEPPLLPQK